MLKGLTPRTVVWCLCVQGSFLCFCAWIDFVDLTRMD